MKEVEERRGSKFRKRESCNERVTLESSFPTCSYLQEKKREMGDSSVYLQTRLD